MSSSSTLSYSSSFVTKKKIPSSYFSSSKKLSSWNRKFFFSRLGYILLFFVGVAFVSLFVGYLYLKSSLPPLGKVNDVLDQATIIKDRKGEILYKIYQENRSYVDFDQISPNMVKAIVAIEDKTFWTNDGIDFWGIIRAARNTIFKGKSEGASTITQQLLKNILLDNESSKYTRKLKERLLAGELNDFVRKQVKKNNPGISKDDLDREMKEQILELYLNYIFLGQNSYGVEAASQTFFAKKAKDLSPLEASILASLPKSPTKYNPYKDPTIVMGKLHFYEGDKEVSPTKITRKKAVDQVSSLLPRLNIEGTSVDSFRKQLAGLMNFSLSSEGKNYRVTYDFGRKDYVLMNMVEQGLLDPALFKIAFLDAFNYSFVRGQRTDIKAPHFVWWVKDVVLSMYPDQGEELLNRGGLEITTTLDYQMQQWAEAAIKENYKKTLGNGANNSSMIYVDSKNGDVLSYVGSVDYQNKQIDGEVDIIRSKRQPGSSIKPFIYALGIQKLGLTADTPIYDLKFRAGRNAPNNSDGRFQGYMPLRKALAYSRNIAPIKIFLSLGGESVVKPFLRYIGLKSLDGRINYGYPLSIGAGEVQMLELANAYMHLSAAGKPAEINPILEIKNSDGSILYSKEVKKQKEYIPEGVANLVSSILSNRLNMPPGWRSSYTFPGLTYATKTGTSDMKIKVNGREQLRARDGRMAAYTPSKVAIFWSGNTDAKPMGKKAWGGRLNSPIWKAFWGQLKKNNLIANESFSLKGTRGLSIEKYSGLLPVADLPKDALVSTRAFAGNMPSGRSPARKPVKYDVSCNGRVTFLTPEEDTKDGRIITPTTFMPNKKDLDSISSRFTTQSGLFLKEPEDACEGRSAEEDKSISISVPDLSDGATVQKIFSFSYQVSGPRPLRYMKVYLNDQEVKDISLQEQKSANGVLSISAYAGMDIGSHVLMLEVVDTEGFVNTKQIPIVVSHPTTNGTGSTTNGTGSTTNGTGSTTNGTGSTTNTGSTGN